MHWRLMIRQQLPQQWSVLLYRGGLCSDVYRREQRIVLPM
jgi:hypothetical protein